MWTSECRAARIGRSTQISRVMPPRTHVRGHDSLYQIAPKYKPMSLVRDLVVAGVGELVDEEAGKLVGAAGRDLVGAGVGEQVNWPMREQKTWSLRQAAIWSARESES
ncbi:unnamed protein product [Prorocentrum cordatum]|uniref:Uncharacterized protein n=1 Tax=Prorocentrum cordatum TaxID=2364126 RepID=A0ABN9P671_9DINO|nr:unnamed protein product [Polarella glacialis]